MMSGRVVGGDGPPADRDQQCGREQRPHGGRDTLPQPEDGEHADEDLQEGDGQPRADGVREGEVTQRFGDGPRLERAQPGDHRAAVAPVEVDRVAQLAHAGVDRDEAEEDRAAAAARRRGSSGVRGSRRAAPRRRGGGEARPRSAAGRGRSGAGWSKAPRPGGPRSAAAALWSRAAAGRAGPRRWVRRWSRRSWAAPAWWLRHSRVRAARVPQTALVRTAACSSWWAPVSSSPVRPLHTTGARRRPPVARTPWDAAALRAGARSEVLTGAGPASCTRKLALLTTTWAGSDGTLTELSTGSSSKKPRGAPPSGSFRPEPDGDGVRAVLVSTLI